MRRAFMNMFPDGAPAVGVGGDTANIQLKGNLKNVKTKSVQTGEGANKTTSVFVDSAKAYATDDKNTNAKVDYNEAKAGQNASIFDNAFKGLKGDNIKQQAFANLQGAAKEIANKDQRSDLSKTTANFKDIFKNFSVKVGGDKLKASDPKSGQGVTQAMVDSKISGYDTQVKAAATAAAQNAQKTMLEAYQAALKQVAQDATQKAQQQEEQNALNQDLQASKGSSAEASPGADGDKSQVKGQGDGDKSQVKGQGDGDKSQVKGQGDGDKSQVKGQGDGDKSQVKGQGDGDNSQVKGQGDGDKSQVKGQGDGDNPSIKKKSHTVANGENLTKIAKKENEDGYTISAMDIYKDNKAEIDAEAAKHGIKANQQNWIYQGTKLEINLKKKGG